MYQFHIHKTKELETLFKACAEPPSGASLVYLPGEPKPIQSIDYCEVDSDDVELVVNQRHLTVSTNRTNFAQARLAVRWLRTNLEYPWSEKLAVDIPESLREGFVPELEWAQPKSWWDGQQTLTYVDDSQDDLSRYFDGSRHPIVRRGELLGYVQRSELPDDREFLRRPELDALISEAQSKFISEFVSGYVRRYYFKVAGGYILNMGDVNLKFEFK